MFASTILRVRFAVEHVLGCGDVWNTFTYDVTGRGDSATYSALHKGLRSDLLYTAEGPTPFVLCCVTLGKDRMGVPFGISGNQVVFRTNTATFKGVNVWYFTYNPEAAGSDVWLKLVLSFSPAQPGRPSHPSCLLNCEKTIVTSCNAGRRECQGLRAQVHPKGCLGLCEWPRGPETGPESSTREGLRAPET